MLNHHPGSLVLLFFCLGLLPFYGAADAGSAPSKVNYQNHASVMEYFKTQIAKDDWKASAREAGELHFENKISPESLPRLLSKLQLSNGPDIKVELGIEAARTTQPEALNMNSKDLSQRSSLAAEDRKRFTRKSAAYDNFRARFSSRPYDDKKKRTRQSNAIDKSIGAGAANARNWGINEITLADARAELGSQRLRPLTVLQDKKAAGKPSAGDDPSGWLHTANARPPENREQVLESDILARRALKYLGDFSLLTMDKLDYIFDFGYSENWSGSVGETESGSLSCQDDGGYNITVTRDDFRKVSGSIQVQDCESDGFIANGNLSFTYDDAHWWQDSPRYDFPLTLSPSNLTITDPQGRGFTYSGGLACDAAANEAAWSFVITDVDGEATVNREYGSLLDRSIDVGYDYLIRNTAGNTASSLIHSWNCDAGSVSVRHANQTHVIRDTKFIMDQYWESVVISQNREDRLAKINRGSFNYGVNSNFSEGFDHQAYDNFFFLDAFSDFNQENQAYSLESDTTDANGVRTVVYGYTIQTTQYHAQYMQDGYPSGANMPTVNYSIDFNGDGEDDTGEYLNLAYIETPNQCFWKIIWNDNGEAVYVEYQPDEQGYCQVSDYFKVVNYADIVIEDADGDGISDALDNDADNDGLTDAEEATLGTNPLVADTDLDGVDDGIDAFPLNTIESVDTDGDGVGDYADDFPEDSALQYQLITDALGKIPDLELRSCIESQSAGLEVTPQLKFLSCWENVQSLEGLANFKGLNYIFLGGGFPQADLAEVQGLRVVLLLLIDNPNITDLSPIFDFRFLSGLYIRGAGLSNDSLLQLTGAENLHASITSLQLSGVFSQLSALSSFASVDFLALESDELTGVELSGLSRLNRLVIESENLVDLEGLSARSSLESLTIFSASLSDLSPITGLNLLVLGIERAPLAEFGQLYSMSSLELLRLNQTGLSTLDFLVSPDGTVGFANMDFLDVSENNIVDIGIVTEISSLGSLAIKSNPVFSIDAVSELNYLTSLNISSTEVDDLAPLVGLQLELLLADNLGLTTVGPLADMSSLASLSLEENLIDDIQTLASLSLINLSLGKNRLVSIEPLSGMLTLSDLKLFENSIENIQPLTNLSPEYLDLTDNSARAIETAFDYIDQGTIHLTGNPILCPSLDRYLEIKPADVTLVFDLESCLSDSDDDGVEDDLDDFPLDATESLDSDVDGVGNNADTDDDNDDVLDADDAFPLDAAESIDTDADGIGNNADPDDDNDGVVDGSDAFPLDSTESQDTDNDGTGNNADAFPENPEETTDTDSDLIGDNSDNCLDVANSNQLNSDSDTLGNACDSDDDNDGIADDTDGFPLISLGDLVDTDGDGRPNDCGTDCLLTGMQADSDDDNDGQLDSDEIACGSDAVDQNSVSLDTDRDAQPDCVDLDDDNDGLADEQEALTGTDPFKRDTDNDTLLDGFEVAVDRNPLIADYGIATRKQFTCAIEDVGVRCWGENAYNKLNPPALNRPRKIGVGWEHGCVLDETPNGNEVLCWGGGGSGETVVPALVNPIDLSVGSQSNCVLDDEGVKCWGWGGNGETSVPELSNPKKIAAGSQTHCAIDDNGVTCWGWNGNNEASPPAGLDSPDSIAGGEWSSCAIQNGEVICWGLLSEPAVPNLDQPFDLGVGKNFACALDSSGLVCWGFNNDYSQQNLPFQPLQNPVALSVGQNNVCVLDDLGYQCWGNNDWGQSDVPTDLTMDQDLDGISSMLDAFPFDATESSDADNDGVGDNADAFPQDASEASDYDGDGVGDNGDNCSITANSDQVNTDGDSEGDACDLDDDNDGFSDEQEAIDGTNPLSAFSCSEGCFSFDIDADEQLEADALTDGLLVIRHLFGFSGDALISGAISNDATRQDAAEITSYLNDAESELDIDGDGEADALTDGLILIRYLFGFSGDALISGAIGENAERTTAEQIEAYISERIPVI
jgi:hypothetical protein